MIAARGEIGIDVMVELCQCVLDGRGMPDEWALSVVIPIFKGERGHDKLWCVQGSEVVRTCNKDCRKSFGGENTEYGESGGGAVWLDAVFILRRLQEEYWDKGKKLYKCFVDLEIHGRCAKVKTVTLKFGRDFVCGGCEKGGKELVEPVVELC